ncbi:hypothetical protein H109_01021 [Trichophyton interdigitale MR816]|uniref:Sister chromatid cohesion protein Ctf8 n=1 Tax=Trichophyton interdigitale (strain MR816) TaxID=1215338 RepID=A0A059JH17_TRIIM|nr:hypothetical protein H101_03176 [Trichophyton interdigitale H6]KDB27150.1 hypothetical protein H109_01021 [Trichophyton interdigitale MR816]
MPTVPLHISLSSNRNGCSTETVANPLPQLLQTPSGLAILELQGTINLPESDEHAMQDNIPVVSQHTHKVETPIGRVIFADYDPAADPSDRGWMKRVYLTVGQHQRLTGEVKKLPKPIAVIQRRKSTVRDAMSSQSVAQDGYIPATPDQLEIVEIIKYKIMFSSRPEPITNEGF